MSSSLQSASWALPGTMASAMTMLALRSVCPSMASPSKCLNRQLGNRPSPVGQSCTTQHSHRLCRSHTGALLLLCKQTVSALCLHVFIVAFACSAFHMSAQYAAFLPVVLAFSQSVRSHTAKDNSLLAILNPIITFHCQLTCISNHSF